MKINESKPAIVGVGAFMAASLGVSLSASLDEDATNLFVAESLDDIDVLAAEDEEEASCGEGQCGDDEDDEDGEDGDDEGECGEDEGGCGEGQCGEEDDADEDDEDADEEEEEETTEE